MNNFALMMIAAFALCPGWSSPALGAAADISGAMTADYLSRCEKDQNACREFANEVMQVMQLAARLGQGRIYKGCAPLPLDANAATQLVQRMRERPQQATGYAADDIAAAAEALWPCR